MHECTALQLVVAIAYIADHHPEMQDNINNMFPGYQGLQDAQGLDETLSSFLLNLVRCMNGCTMDALIDHDRMKTLLELLENATEQDVLRAVLTKDYDNLKGLLASTSKQASTNVGLSSYRGTLFSGEAASDVETTTGDAKSAAEQSSHGSSSKGDEASGSDFNARQKSISAHMCALLTLKVYESTTIVLLTYLKQT